jgi:hypothetical protein
LSHIILPKVPAVHVRSLRFMQHACMHCVVYALCGVCIVWCKHLLCYTPHTRGRCINRYDTLPSAYFTAALSS